MEALVWILGAGFLAQTAVNFAVMFHTTKTLKLSREVIDHSKEVIAFNKKLTQDRD